MIARNTSRNRLIVALDVPSVAEASVLTETLGETVSHYKIGHALQFTGGLTLAADLVRSGRSVFLDVKLHDIPNTVANGVARLADLGIGFLTVHAYPQTMEAAANAAQGSSLKILGVTVLTSMDDHDLREAGYQLTARDLVLARARQAIEAGVDGIVCAPSELGPLRDAFGSKLTLVTPGIRPLTADVGDQKRVMAPSAAIREGADFLVVGRPICTATDPRAVAGTIVADIESQK